MFNFSLYFLPNTNQTVYLHHKAIALGSVFSHWFQCCLNKFVSSAAAMISLWPCTDPCLTFGRLLQSCWGEHGLAHAGRLQPGQALLALFLSSLHLLQLTSVIPGCRRGSCGGESQQRSIWHYGPPSVHFVRLAWHPCQLGQQVNNQVNKLTLQFFVYLLEMYSYFTQNTLLIFHCIFDTVRTVNKMCFMWDAGHVIMRQWETGRRYSNNSVCTNKENGNIHPCFPEGTLFFAVGSLKHVLMLLFLHNHPPAQ